MRISRTTRSCTLHLKVYETYHVGAAIGDGWYSHRRCHRCQPKSRRGKAPRRFSLRLDIESWSQVLQINRCLYHLTAASHVDQDIMCSKVPSLHRRYPASSLLRTSPPPSRLRPTSRCCRLYDLPCSTDFSMGRGRLLQLLSMSLSPCCPYHPAEVTCRAGQLATSHIAFAPPQSARPSKLFFVGATYGFTFVTAR